MDTFLGPFNRLPMHDHFFASLSLVSCFSFVVLRVDISQGHRIYPKHSIYRTKTPLLRAKISGHLSVNTKDSSQSVITLPIPTLRLHSHLQNFLADTDPA